MDNRKSDPKTNQIIVLGNLFPSEHEAGRIVSRGGVSPTVKENHGTVIGVVVSERVEKRERYNNSRQD